MEDGKQAVDYMEEADDDFIDLILMDVTMPVMDGYEATRRMESREKIGEPIIAMNANAFEEDVKTAFAAGMDGHLAKPIRLEALYDIMKKYLCL